MGNNITRAPVKKKGDPDRKSIVIWNNGVIIAEFLADETLCTEKRNNVCKDVNRNGNYAFVFPNAFVFSYWNANSEQIINYINGIFNPKTNGNKFF